MDVCEIQFGPVIPQEIIDKVEDYEIMDKEQQEETEEKEKQNLQLLPFLRGPTELSMEKFWQTWTIIY